MVWWTSAKLVPSSCPLPADGIVNTKTSLKSHDRGVGSRLFENSVFFYDIKHISTSNTDLIIGQGYMQ